MNFKKSLQVGNDGQKILKDILASAGFACEESVGKDSRFDIKAQKNNLIITFEVKFDKYSEKSGNLAFEYQNSNSNKNSGITATTANIWSQIMPPREVWIINTNKLKEYIKNNKPFRTIIDAGDGNANLFLYKKSDIIHIFTRLDNIEQENIEGAIRECLQYATDSDDQ